LLRSAHCRGNQLIYQFDGVQGFTGEQERTRPLTELFGDLIGPYAREIFRAALPLVGLQLCVLDDFRYERSLAAFEFRGWRR